MADFFQENLRGSRFEDLYLTESLIKNCDLTGVRVRGSWIRNVTLDGEIDGLVVNGIDVTAYVDAELNRRWPGRDKMRPTDPAGFREAWSVIEERWADTVARARRLPEALLHERVDGEWSVVENLRHLVFATDSWVRRAILGEPAPWHPFCLPHDDMDSSATPVPRDRDADPSFDEVLAVRAERMATVRSVIEGLTDESLAGRTTPVTEPGYPKPGEAFPVKEILSSILNEEWEHRRYVERDLDALEARS